MEPNHRHSSLISFGCVPCFLSIVHLKGTISLLRFHSLLFVLTSKPPSALVLDKCTHSVRARTHKQTSKATISKLLRPSSVAKIRGLAAAGVTRSRKRCKVSFLYMCVQYRTSRFSYFFISVKQSVRKNKH